MNQKLKNTLKTIGLCTLLLGSPLNSYARGNSCIENYVPDRTQDTTDCNCKEPECVQKEYLHIKEKIANKDYSWKEDEKYKKLDSLIYYPFGFRRKIGTNDIKSKFKGGRVERFNREEIYSSQNDPTSLTDTPITIIKLSNDAMNLFVGQRIMNNKIVREKIMCYEILEPYVCLKYGIMIGTKREYIRKLLGTPNVICIDEDVYCAPKLTELDDKIVFEYDGAKVEKITIEYLRKYTQKIPKKEKGPNFSIDRLDAANQIQQSICDKKQKKSK